MVTERDPNLTTRDISKNVAGQLIEKWQKVNPKLVLLLEDSVVLKVERVFKTAKDINNKKATTKVKKQLDKKLNKLFDIAACECDLPEVSCKEAKCKTTNCTANHILCLCDVSKKVRILVLIKKT